MSKPVLVTTEFRGVFFGYTEHEKADPISLTAARNCIYWPPEQGGFLGLASEGPVKGSRIGARSDITLSKVTSVAPVTPAAVERWEAIETYRG